MQKVMIFLKKPPELPAAAFFQSICAAIKPFLPDYDHIRLAIRDADVNDAMPLAMISTQHPKDAVLSVLAQDKIAIPVLLEGLMPVVDAAQVYEVQQYEPLTADQPLGRLPGMCQLALLKRPSQLSRENWLDIWLNTHTQIAIETQSTFSYRQNVVLKQLNAKDVIEYDAIVEEQFPVAAMTDRKVFFNAPDDENLFRSNEKRMIESVSRFVDFTQFECVPMSEYRLK